MIHNPKRSAELIKKDASWYDYYAGFSRSFTQSALRAATPPPDSIILDPWNGAGTTTKTCSLEGFKSVGIDLNPAMVVISKAQLVTQSDVEFAIGRCSSLNSNFKVEVREDDALTAWFCPESVQMIRKIEKSILKINKFNSLEGKVDSLSYSQCFQYVVLFNIVRQYLSPFIPTNPTWIKKAQTEDEKVRLKWKALRDDFIGGAYKLSESIDYVSMQNSQIKTASSINIPLEDSSVDLVLSSPPYCTRIDYAVATLPELAILSVSGLEEITPIRKSLMGATTVPKSVNEGAMFGPICEEFLSKVKTHSSRASSTYYYKNFYQYFYDLSHSVSEILRVLKPGGKCFLVVQDSYYKDIHCDLASIIVQFFSANGGLLVNSYDFVSKNNMANINPRGRKYRVKTKAVESVIELTKAE
ncbi:DNA methyltransferase [Shewanella algae]|uniref:DNA methyltransferase n=1 Tax=Shewanella algae TaxID=38313 RepID=UPI002230DF5F|nr:DNA methyltransferase [Shewanella algae]UZD59971.1 DNA methyltransferase [Shewanella algae]